MCPYPDVVDALAACVEELARGDGPAAYAAYDTASMLVTRRGIEGAAEAVLAARGAIVAAVIERTGDASTSREVTERVLGGKLMPQLLTSAR